MSRSIAVPQRLLIGAIATVAVVSVSMIPARDDRVPFVEGPRAWEDLAAGILDPEHVAWSVTRTTVYHGIPRDAVARADAYVRSIVRERTGREPGDGYVAAALVEVADVTREHSYLELIRGEKDGWRSEIHNTSDQGSPVVIEQWIGPEEVVTTTVVDGRPQPTLRTPFQSVAISCRGALADLGRLFDQGGAVLDLAPGARIAFEESGTTGPTSIPEGLWERLASTLPRHGVINTAETFELRRSVEGPTETLGLAWFDPRSLPILGITLTLTASRHGSPQIVGLHRVHFLPGTTDPVQDTTLAFRADGQLPTDSPSWSPGLEEEVFDWRFDGVPLHYRTGDGGGLPADDVLRARALSEAALYWAALIDVGHDTFSDFRGSSSRVELDLQDGRRGQLSVRPGVALAGPHPIGSMLPIAFQLENSGDVPLRFGEPRTDCGCTRVRLSSHDVAPRGVAVVQAVVEVQDVGSMTRTIRVPVDGGREIDLTVNYAGEQSAMLRPRFVDLGVVEETEWPVTVDFEIDMRGTSPISRRLSFSAGDGLRVVRANPSGEQPWRQTALTLTRDDTLYGAHLARVTTVSGDDSSSMRSVVHYEVRHPDAEAWPFCHVAVDEQRPATIAFPGLHFDPHSVTMPDESAAIVADVTGGDRDQIAISVAPGGIPNTQALVRVHVRTTTGDTIQLLVFPSAQLEGTPPGR